MTVFFLVLTSTIEGVHEVDRTVINALVLMGATRTESIRKVLIWAALPWNFTSMRIAVRYAQSIIHSAQSAPIDRDRLSGRGSRQRRSQQQHERNDVA